MLFGMLVLCWGGAGERLYFPYSEDLSRKLPVLVGSAPVSVACTGRDLDGGLASDYLSKIAGLGLNDFSLDQSRSVVGGFEVLGTMAPQHGKGLIVAYSWKGNDLFAAGACIAYLPSISDREMLEDSASAGASLLRVFAGWIIMAESLAKGNSEEVGGLDRASRQAASVSAVSAVLKQVPAVRQGLVLRHLFSTSAGFLPLFSDDVKSKLLSADAAFRVVAAKLPQLFQQIVKVEASYDRNEADLWSVLGRLVNMCKTEGVLDVGMKRALGTANVRYFENLLEVSQPTIVKTFEAIHTWLTEEIRRNQKNQRLRSAKFRLVKLLRYSGVPSLAQLVKGEAEELVETY